MRKSPPVITSVLDLTGVPAIQRHIPGLVWVLASLAAALALIFMGMNL